MCVCVRDLQNHFEHVYVWKRLDSESPASKEPKSQGNPQESKINPDGSSVDDLVLTYMMGRKTYHSRE